MTRSAIFHAGLRRRAGFTLLVGSLWGAAALASGGEAFARLFLNRYHAAQEVFFKQYGYYPDHPRKLIHPSGWRFVDTELVTWAEAAFHPDEKTPPPPERQTEGYYFVHLHQYGIGAMDENKGYVVCAIPVPGGNGFTYCVGPKGIVLRKELKGRAVVNALEVDSSWEPAP